MDLKYLADNVYFTSESSNDIKQIVVNDINSLQGARNKAFKLYTTLETFTSRREIQQLLKYKILSFVSAATKQIFELVLQQMIREISNPLWWSVIDLREEKVSPCPYLPRAKEFLLAKDVDELHLCAIEIVQSASSLNVSVNALLKSFALADIMSIQELAKERGTLGIAGIRNLLEKTNENGETDEELGECAKNLENIDKRDDDTIYVWGCLEDALHSSVTPYIRDLEIYGFRTTAAQMSQNDRWTCISLDLLQRHPTPPLNSREEKASRSNVVRSGKACNFLFLTRHRETGIGENSGPNHRENHEKAVTDFIDVVKPANEMIECSASNPLPAALVDAMKFIVIPFFHVIGMCIRFYILMQVS
ncbi:hypothetical protein G9A89_014236 [Geosiphon pyriformis]|nr:hypothetical protein G9A89_014236 [Geosiphon pyriformis]